MREFLLFVHLIGLALGLGTSFAFMALGIATKDMTPAGKGGPAATLAKVPKVSPFAMLTTILIVLAAVLAFH